jgi:hypothetical protein
MSLRVMRYRLVKEAADRMSALVTSDSATRQLRFNASQAALLMESGLLVRVELRGLEPLTPTLPVWCATSCATAPCRPGLVCPSRGEQYNRVNGARRRGSPTGHRVVSLRCRTARPAPG